MGALQQILSSYKAAGGGGSVALDTNSSASTTGNPATWSTAYTVSGSDRYLLATLLSDRTVASAPTYNGTSMTVLGSESLSALIFIELKMYGLIAPATGVNNLVFDLSGGAPANFVLFIASFTGVHQSAPIGTVVTNKIDAQTQATGDAPLTLTVGQAAYASMLSYNRTVTTPSLTLLNAVNNGGSSGGHAYRIMGSSATENCQFDWTGNQIWAEVSIPILPA